jgi:hypothetical protein
MLYNTQKYDIQLLYFNLYPENRHTKSILSNQSTQVYLFDFLWIIFCLFVINMKSITFNIFGSFIIFIAFIEL